MTPGVPNLSDPFPSLRQMLSDPTVIKRLQEQLAQSVSPGAIARMQEQLAQSVSPGAIARMQEQLAQSVSPGAIARMQEQVNAVATEEFIDHLNGLLTAGAPQVTEALRDAVAAWSADVEALTAADANELSQLGFGWVDLLPTVAQLKLLLTTMAALNAALILIVWVKPGSAPMPLLLTVELLIRLAQVLVERLNSG